MSKRALEMAKAKQEKAWKRACNATNAGARNYWTSENNRLAELVIKIGYRLEAVELATA